MQKLALLGKIPTNSQFWSLTAPTMVLVAVVAAVVMAKLFDELKVIEGEGD